jgi:hypothetical protein
MVLRRCALLVGILTLAAGCGGSGGGLSLTAPTDRPPSVDPTGMPTDEPTDDPTSAPTTGGAQAGPHTIVYKAAGSGEVKVYYRSKDTDDAGNLPMEKPPSMPWSRTVTLEDPERAIVMVESGTSQVSCTITVDGTVTSTQSAANVAMCP